MSAWVNKVIPRFKHPEDLRRVLVVAKAPKHVNGHKTELFFEGPGAVGYYGMPGGALTSIIVDPSIPNGHWRLEDALTGKVHSASQFPVG